MFEESLQKLNEIFNRTDKNLYTIEKLLEKGDLKLRNKLISSSETMNIETIYRSNISVTIGKFKKRGDSYPLHIHKDIIEYLICLKGSIGIQIGNGYRILKYKECASIPENTLHSNLALEDDCEVIAICIPFEENYNITI